ncbi:MAG: 16S rRNA (uracil(1498)-N(3))-methyltransferase [Rhodospirillaceae bacterium]|nr:16S rRNA (uracil(1498)-N(3))-methyltransferase [Rhodospirillaceae bacterium]
MNDLPRTRLYVGSPLGPALSVPLTPTQTHHLNIVLRKNAGDAIRLFNGQDGEWLARLDRIGRSGATATVDRRLRPQTPAPDLCLLATPLKRGRMEWLVEKATELGVAEIQLILTMNTDAPRPKVDKLAIHAVEAAQQCERLDVPVLHPPAELARVLAGWPKARPLAVAAERAPSSGVPPENLAEVARRHPGGPAGLLVGPEGGLTVSELDDLRDLPFVALVGLGPRILRAETAALAALACWQCLAGDGSVSPPLRSVSTTGAC